MGGLLSVCCPAREFDFALSEFGSPVRVEPERRASKTASVLDPETFEFVDALYMPKENPAQTLELPPRAIVKRNSLTAWLAGGLFASRSSHASRADGGSALRDRPQMRAVKMLMCGTGESGKSTVVKQMKVIHQGGFSPEELGDFRPQIYRNIQDAMLQILDTIDYAELTRDSKTLVCAAVRAVLTL